MDGFRIFKVNLSVTLGAADPLVDEESIKQLLTHTVVVEQVRQGLWNEFLDVNKKQGNPQISQIPQILQDRRMNDER
jgi:hypothetical protein